MNKDAWGGLSDQHKAMIEIAAGESIHHTSVATEAMNPSAMNKLLEDYGVTHKRWSDEDLAKCEQAWSEVLEEESANDPVFKKVADSYLAWRKVYKTWGDAQSLKPTYIGN
jgi:TRAP-type mannitol/chloroaromatic compound transport system substrate-binding protein